MTVFKLLYLESSLFLNTFQPSKIMKKTLLILSSIFIIATITSLFQQDDVTSCHAEFSKTRASLGFNQAIAYPPGVGILTNSKNCLSCHANNGPWKEDANNIIDIIDKETKKSLKQADGTFLITAKRYEAKTVYTVLGRKDSEGILSPTKNAWIYIDTTLIGKSTLSKFAPNWEVNLQLSCRITGDKVDNFANSTLTSLPMTIRALSTAKDENIMLQVMLTKGEAEKGNPNNTLKGNYFEKSVRLKIIE